MKKIKLTLSKASRHVFLGGVMKKSSNFLPLTGREKTMIKHSIKSFFKLNLVIITLIAIMILWKFPAGVTLSTESLSVAQNSQKVQSIKTSIKTSEAKAEAIKNTISDDIKELKTVQATVYAYNSFESQTDGDPCTGAFGYICDKTNVVANNCYLKGTIVEILGEKYEVYDRMNSRYGCDVFDIYMGMDHQKALNFGVKHIPVKIFKKNK